MEITKGIEMIDLALYLKKEKILVIADLHIGYEEALNKQGILVPRFHYKDLIDRLGKILIQTEPETIIINGDLKHEFGRISEQEWRETLRVLDFLSKHCRRIILIKGNHDNILGPIAKKRNVEIVKEYRIGSIIVVHGDKIPKTKSFKSAKTIIIGHEHPAISLRDDVRTEKFKCFIKGKYKRKTLIVQPSCNLITEGTDIQSQDLLSPFLRQSLDRFEVFVVSDRVYGFGKLGNLG